MYKMVNERKGFTLIELIIVIAILAILALIGLPLIGQYMQDADIAADNATAQVIGRAAEAYMAAHPGVEPTYAQLNDYLNANAKGLSGVTISYTDGSPTVTYGNGKYPAVPTT